ncbi:DNA-binding MurR/RpiR family transcriptional regulator [Burkholderia sp. 572]
MKIYFFSQLGLCKFISIILSTTLRMTPLAPHDASHDEPAIAERIASAMPLMTPIHRRMGEFVLANPFRAATMRIDELAQAVNASIATANRFAKALGFDGYPAMRAALVRGFEATLGPVERLRSAQEQESGVRGAAWIDAVFDQAVANIENTRAQLDAADVEAAVEAIVGARRVLILGAGSSAFLAGLMEHGLSVCHDNVQSLALLGGPSHAARRLYTADSRDLVIALAFPRYVKDTIELARRAAARGARVLGISDGPQSPLAPIASLNLYVKAERRFAATSEAAVLTMIEALIDAVALRTHRSAKSAAEMTEFLLPWLMQPQATQPAANPSSHRPKKT